VGEFEDAALAKVAAAEGYGITVVPTLVEKEAMERYGFVAVGRTDECVVRLFLVTAERSFEHPAVALLAKHFAQDTAGIRKTPREKTRKSLSPPKSKGRTGKKNGT